jgi:hypothetical protein
MRTSQNICAYPKYLLMLKIYAHILKYLCISKIFSYIKKICAYLKYMRLIENICAYLKYMRLIIYDSNKADIEISAPMKNIFAHQK